MCGVCIACFCTLGLEVGGGFCLGKIGVDVSGGLCNGNNSAHPVSWMRAVPLLPNFHDHSP